MNIVERILVEGFDRYSSVNEKQYYRDSEKKFEKTVKRILPEFLKTRDLNFEIFKFTPHLSSKNWDATQPDLFIMSSNYEYYGIIEVELTHHSLEGHVIPQMQSIVHAEYIDNAKEIYNHLKKHNRNNFKYCESKFCKMIELVNPEFICISEDYKDTWDTELKKLGVRYFGLNEYINNMGKNVYHLKDSSPKKSFKEIEIKWLGSYFKFNHRENKTLKNGENYKLKYKNNVRIFKVYRRSQKEIYLLPEFEVTEKMYKNERYILSFKDGFLNITEVTKQ